MIIVDANVLINAVNQPAEHHQRARTWLDTAMTGTDVIGLPWISILAFLRISTNARIFDRPLAVSHAAALVRSWIDAPAAIVPMPGNDHVTTLTRLLETVGTAGNIVNDAHLAALALEYDGEVVTFDRDFGRFPGVRWRTP
ncbi:MAG: type II toxin-antitoxin system VapC family toxin [Chloroflexi bacterium]|nr:type II toxin-antitoxin system VapC family toxin [Chloroflexota bacterium]